MPPSVMHSGQENDGASTLHQSSIRIVYYDENELAN